MRFVYKLLTTVPVVVVPDSAVENKQVWRLFTFCLIDVMCVSVRYTDLPVFVVRAGLPRPARLPVPVSLRRGESWL